MHIMRAVHPHMPALLQCRRLIATLNVPWYGDNATDERLPTNPVRFPLIPCQSRRYIRWLFVNIVLKWLSLQLSFWVSGLGELHSQHWTRSSAWNISTSEACRVDIYICASILHTRHINWYLHHCPVSMVCILYIGILACIFYSYNNYSF